MQIDVRRAWWLETAGLTLASILFFRIGLLGLVFLVPVELVWIRRGEQAGLIASGGVLLGIAALKLVDFARFRADFGAGGVPGGLILLDLVFAFGLLLGLFVMNSSRMMMPRLAGHEESTDAPPRGLTVSERMMAAVICGLLVYGPTVAWIATSGSGDALIAAQIQSLRPLFEAAGATSDEIGALTSIVVSAMLSGLLFGYFVMVVGNWWLGAQIAFRSRVALPAGNPIMARHAGYAVTDFRLPHAFVWALIVAWGGVLLTMIADIGGVSYVFWNLAFVTLAMYGIQGLAIVWYYLERRKVRRSARIWLAVGVVLGLLIPGLRFVVGIGIPGLGVSEMWIDYHRFEGSEGAQ